VLQIDDNPCDAGLKEIVDHCTQPAALLSEHISRCVISKGIVCLPKEH
jgi:hypothetical protein